MLIELLSVNAHSQIKDSLDHTSDTTAIKKHKLGFYISPGIILGLFQNDNISNYFIQNSKPYTNSKDTGNLYSSSAAIGAKIDGGIVIFAESESLPLLLGFSYSNMTGKYSSSLTLLNQTSNPELGHSNIYDTTHASYNIQTFSLSFKIQPSYKFLFFSIGTEAGVSIAKVEEQKIEYAFGYNWPQGQLVSDYKNTYSVLSHYAYYTGDFQVGVGGRINYKKFTLKPGIYASLLYGTYLLPQGIIATDLEITLH